MQLLWSQRDDEALVLASSDLLPLLQSRHERGGGQKRPREEDSSDEGAAPSHGDGATSEEVRGSWHSRIPQEQFDVLHDMVGDAVTMLSCEGLSQEVDATAPQGADATWTACKYFLSDTYLGTVSAAVNIFLLERAGSKLPSHETVLQLTTTHLQALINYEKSREPLHAKAPTEQTKYRAHMIQWPV